MERNNNNKDRSSESASTTLDSILKQIDDIDLENLSVDDRARIYKAIQRKFGIDSSMNIHTLGAQMMANKIQINVCDSSSMSDLVSVLIEKLGKENVVQLIKAVLDKI